MSNTLSRSVAAALATAAILAAVALYSLSSTDARPDGKPADFSATHARSRAISEEGTPRQDSRVAESNATFAVRVLRSGTSSPLSGAKLYRVLNDGASTLLGISDDHGAIHIDDSCGEAWIALAGYALKRIECVEGSKKPAVFELTEIPSVSIAIVEGCTAQSILSHDFTVLTRLTDEKASTAYRAIFGRAPGVLKEWDGIGILTIDVPALGNYGVQVSAVPKSGKGRQASSGHASLDSRFTSYGAKFSPPLSESRLSVWLDVSVPFPVDADMDVELRGPYAGEGGSRIKNMSQLHNFEGLETNVAGECFVEGVTPGYYECSCLVYGFGTFRIGRYEIKKDGQRVRIQGSGDFVRGTVRCLNAPENSVLEASVRRGRRPIAGRVFDNTKGDGSPELSEWEVILPRNESRVYALARVYQTRIVSIPVAVPTSIDGFTVALADWRKEQEVGFRLPKARSVYDLRWVEITHMNSSVRWSTDASIDEQARTFCVPGTYEARLCWPGERSDAVAFTVGDSKIEISL